VRRRVVVSSEARKDLLRLNAFLAEKSDRAARRAMDGIDAALRGLADYADRGREIGDGVRILPIPFGQSGYVARYRVEADQIVIARVFHMREDRDDG